MIYVMQNKMWTVDAKNICGSIVPLNINIGKDHLILAEIPDILNMIETIFFFIKIILHSRSAILAQNFFVLFELSF